MNIDEIIVDPEFEALIPPLSDEEYDQLCSNITAEGVVRDPLVVWRDENILLDGHNRLRFLKSIPDDEWPFSVELRRMRSRERAKVWIIQNQLGRRNLTDGHKYELIQKRKDILAEKGKATQGQRTDLLSTIDKKSHDTRAEIATELGWSTGKVGMADKVWREAEPEVKEKIKNNEISIHAAYQELKGPKKKKPDTESIPIVIEEQERQEPQSIPLVKETASGEVKEAASRKKWTSHDTRQAIDRSVKEVEGRLQEFPQNQREAFLRGLISTLQRKHDNIMREEAR